jgi:uncharacterized protein (DUF4415 family)
VQAVSHGHPRYGRPPTKSNVCLPLRKDFLRKFLKSGVSWQRRKRFWSWH